MFCVIASPARTFSSLVANVMHNSGIKMSIPGAPMNSPDYANPHGFYEAGWSINLNEHLLKRVGSSGVKSMGNPPSIESVKSLMDTGDQGLIFDALRHLFHLMEDAEIKDFGVKDNRICYLAPLWFAPLLTFEARLITIDRPEDMAVASIMSAWPKEFFWREDAVIAFREARRRIDAMIERWPYPTHRVKGDALFDDTETELGRLSDFVGRPIKSDTVDRTGRHHETA